jgi:hypothetical protein
MEICILYVFIITNFPWSLNKMYSLKAAVGVIYIEQCHKVQGGYLRACCKLFGQFSRRETSSLCQVIPCMFVPWCSQQHHRPTNCTQTPPRSQEMLEMSLLCMHFLHHHKNVPFTYLSSILKPEQT